MPNRTSKTGSELFIVDNSDEDWKVLRYLHDWCQISGRSHADCRIHSLPARHAAPLHLGTAHAGRNPGERREVHQERLPEERASPLRRQAGA